MNTLAGYIGTLCVGAAGTYLSQFLRPKIKLRYWLSHSFTYNIPNAQLNPNPPYVVPGAANHALPPAAPAHFYLLTQSVTIQNFGRERAEWVEIVHKQKPDFFQLQPALNYTEIISQTGEHTLRVESLAPREFFTIQFLCYTHMPALMHIRSEAGLGKSMPWMAVRKYPQWFYATVLIATVTGVAFFTYWIIRGGMFVLKGIGAL